MSRKKQTMNLISEVDKEMIMFSDGGLIVEQGTFGVAIGNCDNTVIQN